MGDVATAQPYVAPHPAASPPTIQIIVVDEKGTKANCKLYRTEKLSEILRKYNSRLHTSYDSIMINNSPIQLSQTPALLGLEDGQVLKFCKTSTGTNTTVTSTSSTLPSTVPLANGTTANNLSRSQTTSPLPLSDDTDRTAQLEQRIAALQQELEHANQRQEVLHAQIVNLENKVTEEQEKTQCRICFDRYRDTVIFPCLHFSYCNKCLEDLAQRTRECPSCRGHISGVLRMQIG